MSQQEKDIREGGDSGFSEFKKQVQQNTGLMATEFRKAEPMLRKLFHDEPWADPAVAADEVMRFLRDQKSEASFTEVSKLLESLVKDMHRQQRQNR